LDDLYRIAHQGYEPTDEDVVRARLRTVGVQEYRFSLDTGAYFYLDTLTVASKAEIQAVNGFFMMSEGHGRT